MYGAMPPITWTVMTPLLAEHVEFVVDTFTELIPPGLVIHVVALKLHRAASVTWNV